MLIAQLTDLHITAPGRKAFDSHDTIASASAAVDFVNRLDPRPDLVLVTGDIINGPAPGEYEQAARILGRLDIPYLPIPGNHDDRDGMRAAFAHLGLLPAEGPFLHYAHVSGPLRFIMLDTVVPGASEGLLCEERLDWIAGQLATTDRPTLLAMHHPPFRSGMGFMDMIRCRGGAALADLLRGRSDIVGVVCGHLHRTVAVPFAGTTAFCAPSASVQLSLRLGEQAPALSRDPPGLGLHLWSDRDGLRCHALVIADDPGTDLF